MINRGTIPWGTLTRWRGKAFLGAGGLLLASPVAKGLVLITGDPLPEVTIAVLVFSGLLAALGGLLGFYPEQTDHLPRLALAGLVSTVTAAAVTIGVFLWVIGTRVLAAMSYVAIPVTPPEYVFVSLVLAMSVAFSVVGTACLRTAIPSRSVGLLLLALALPWAVLLGAGAVYGPHLPAWLSLSTYGAIPLGLLATGYGIRRNTPMAEREPFSADATTN